MLKRLNSQYAIESSKRTATRNSEDSREIEKTNQESVANAVVASNLSQKKEMVESEANGRQIDEKVESEANGRQIDVKVDSEADGRQNSNESEQSTTRREEENNQVLKMSFSTEMLSKSEQLVNEELKVK